MAHDESSVTSLSVTHLIQELLCLYTCLYVSLSPCANTGEVKSENEVCSPDVKSIPYILCSVNKVIFTSLQPKWEEMIGQPYSKLMVAYLSTHRSISIFTSRQTGALVAMESTASVEVIDKI